MNNEISRKEEEAKSLLESEIFLACPDVEIDWDYHEVTMEHSCQVSNKNRKRTYSFSRDMLRDIITNSTESKNLVRSIISEIERRIA